MGSPPLDARPFGYLTNVRPNWMPNHVVANSVHVCCLIGQLVNWLGMRGRRRQFSMRLVKSALYLLCESRINLSSRGAHLNAAGVRVRLVAANRLPRKSVNSRQCTGVVVRPPTRFAPRRGGVVGAIASGGWPSMCVVQCPIALLH